MKTLVFDQFEFDSFASEESLELNVAAKKYGSVKEFRELNPADQNDQSVISPR